VCHREVVLFSVPNAGGPSAVQGSRARRSGRHDSFLSWSIRSSRMLRHRWLAFRERLVSFPPPSGQTELTPDLVRHHSTDFERFDLAGPALEASGRNLLLTIDFEAFNPSSLDLWLDAMTHWADYSVGGGWGFSIFIALEDIVRLKQSRPSRYRDFLHAAKILNDCGAIFYPHNHGVFDSRTGIQSPNRPTRIPGYGKRASFFYDVVRRHRLSLRGWLNRLLVHYDEFLSDAGIARPTRLAFRAGGWDHGTTPEENATYIDAVSDAGFTYDSSVTHGVFGTRTFRIGAPFRSNIFTLTSSLVEVASCWSLDCGGAAVSPSSISAMRRLLAQPEVWGSRRAEGAFVTAIHFDHLLRSRRGGPEVISASTVHRRIGRFFQFMSYVRTALRLSSSITFEDLRLRRGGARL
jgi:hypothetical protein